MNILSLLSSGRLINLPKPILIALVLICCGGVMGGTYMMSPASGRIMPMAIVGIGIIFVFLLFLMFRAIVRWNAKRKANPMAAGIAGNAAAAPQGISEPARRARLDDLRRNFEQGVEKFRAAGKNLYSVPWYVLVGEPGSGKTEAIRHCNVGFPPGLQDQLQGAGGTLNMNWWFTNSAIILDTAGRLMFEEVAPGSTNEWNEFLKLLRQNRPNSPINGLLLVIPVDTLIKDSADSIEKKATKIAQQFDQIQRILGVRFPVFVIITKCDLLNGFREFFDDLNDPQLQHQIMGWSNPAPLDERFDPAKVTAHLETVKQRLVARRQNLLLDPVNSEDPQSRRVDQVDALYALPDSLINIGPRLRRYLEMIFVAGEWSPKPLFLRGIYFTSSMTEGAALDDELAKVLGVPVDSLPGGAIFRKDRAYFLRDLFLEKVFREKGLVTRAANADGQQRTRRLLVMCFGFISVLILFGVTFWASWDLKKSLGGEVDLWNDVAKQPVKDMLIIDEKGRYHGAADLQIGGKPMSVTDLFSSNFERMQADLQIPFLFRPLTVFDRQGINDQRRSDYRNLFEAAVLKPLYDHARQNFDTTRPLASAKDADDLCNVLVEFIKLEYGAATGKPPAAPGGAVNSKDFDDPEVNLAPLFAIAVAANDADGRKQLETDRAKLQAVVNWLYTDKAHGENKWPPAMLAGDSDANQKQILAAVSLLSTYWDSQRGDSSGALSSINGTKDALDAFQKAEADLLALHQTPIDSFSSYQQYRQEWSKRYKALSDASDKVKAAWAEASKDGSTLAAIYTNKKKSTLDSQTQQIQRLLDVISNLAPAPTDKTGSPPVFAWIQNSLRPPLDQAKSALSNWQSNDALAKDLKDLDDKYLIPVKDPLSPATDAGPAMSPRFQVQAALYKSADDYMKLGDGLQPAAGEKLSDAVARMQTTGTAVIDKANAVKTQNLSAGTPASAPADLLTQAISLTTYTVDGAIRAHKYLLIDGALKGYPADVASWEALIAKNFDGAPREDHDFMARPRIPLVVYPAKFDTTFNTQFSPWAAGAVAARLDELNKLLGPDASAKILDAADLKTRSDKVQNSFKAYKDDYVNYWSVTVKDEISGTNVHPQDFKSFRTTMSNLSDADIADRLTAYGEAMSKALDKISDYLDDAKKADVKKAADDIRASEPGKTLAPTARDCANFRKSWIELGDDPFAARQIILERSALDFSDLYTVKSALNDMANPNSYTVRYWSQLSLSVLSELAGECQAQITQNLGQLAKYEKFPLAPMTADAKNDATLDDLNNLRVILKKIGTTARPATPAAGAPAVPGSLSIRAGGATNNPDINASLVLLRGDQQISPELAAYLTAVSSFLDVLPTDKPVDATVSPMLEKLTGPDSISIPESFLRITQEGKPPVEISIQGGGTINSAPVLYPGPALTIDFKAGPTSPYVAPQKFAGPWALLRLLNDKNVDLSSLSQQGNKWIVQYAVDIPGTTPSKHVLWLTIEFKQPLPDLSKWPKPPANSP